MKRNLLVTGFCFLLVFISLSSFSPAPGSLVDDVLSYTNQFRKSNGQPALIINKDLNAIAETHSINMAKGKVGFGHGGFSKRSDLARKKISGFGSFAENIAFGANSGKEVVTMWKNSSAHRRNMLGQYKYVGIGIAKDGRGTIYYTQVFAY